VAPVRATGAPRRAVVYRHSRDEVSRDELDEAMLTVPTTVLSVVPRPTCRSSRPRPRRMTP